MIAMDDARQRRRQPAPDALDKRLLDDAGLKFESVRLDDINVDPSYQRPLRAAKIDEMLATFDPKEITAIVVNRRIDGSLWVLDGQHRVELLRRLGKSVVIADVREGYDHEMEARAFYRLNRGQTKVSAFDEFRSRVAGNEPSATRIVDIIERHGYHIGRQSEERAIQAVSALEAAFNMGKLNATMSIIATVWPMDAASRSANIIVGLATFLLNFQGRDDYDDGRLLEVLDKLTPTAIQRRAQEIQLQTGRSANRGWTVAIAIRDAYNGEMTRGNRPKHKLHAMPIQFTGKTRVPQRG